MLLNNSVIVKRDAIILQLEDNESSLCLSKFEALEKNRVRYLLTSRQNKIGASGKLDLDLIRKMAST